jgi:hypothetical protein
MAVGDTKSGDGEMIMMTVGNLAKALGEPIWLANFIDNLKLPEVKVQRNADGRLVYGQLTDVYLEGAKAVLAKRDQELLPPTKEEMRRRVPELERKLVEQWHWTFGLFPVRAAELLPFAGDLVDEWASDRGKANALGQRLSRMVGREFNGFKVVESSRKKNTAIYALEPVQDAKDGSA